MKTISMKRMIGAAWGMFAACLLAGCVNVNVPPDEVEDVGGTGSTPATVEQPSIKPSPFIDCAETEGVIQGLAEAHETILQDFWSVCLEGPWCPKGMEPVVSPIDKTIPNSCISTDKLVMYDNSRVLCCGDDDLEPAMVACGDAQDCIDVKLSPESPCMAPACVDNQCVMQLQATGTKCNSNGTCQWGLCFDGSIGK